MMEVERRLRKLQIAYRLSAKPKDADEPFDTERLSVEQRAELAALVAQAAEPTLADRHGLRALSDYELERMTWLGAIGRGEAMDEPLPEPSQDEQDRAGVGYFYGQCLHQDGSFDLGRLTPLQRQRLEQLETQLREGAP